MIPPTGLDAKSSQSSLKSAVAGSKKGKERARPVSMVVSSSAARRAFLDQPQIRVQAPTPLIGPAASTSKGGVVVDAGRASPPPPAFGAPLGVGAGEGVVCCGAGTADPSGAGTVTLAYCTWLESAAPHSPRTW